MHKYNLRSGDVLSGAILAALGTYIVIQASIWPYYEVNGPGPGFFPLWYGILMVGLSVWLIITAAMKAAPDQQKRDFTGLGRALIVWAAFAACLALMAYLGFTISFALFTIFIVTYVFQRSFVAATLTGVISAVAFYITFAKLLGVQLPTGFVGF
jgi:putative tricarboxylic transport membrane protein